MTAHNTTAAGPGRKLSRAEIALLDQRRPLRQAQRILRVIPQLTDDPVMKELAEIGADLLNRCEVIADEGMPEDAQ